jgi:hypothetical protein
MCLSHTPLYAVSSPLHRRQKYAQASSTTANISQHVPTQLLISIHSLSHSPDSHHTISSDGGGFATHTQHRTELQTAYTVSTWSVEHTWQSGSGGVNQSIRHHPCWWRSESTGHTYTGLQPWPEPLTCLLSRDSIAHDYGTHLQHHSPYIEEAYTGRGDASRSLVSWQLQA